MKLALFLGCNVPTQAFNYEAAVRKVADRFDVKLVDIPDFGCCGEFTEAMDSYTALVFAARNIALAEKRNLNILTLCNGCFLSLNKARHELEDQQLRSKVNHVLEKINLSYKGKSQIFHFHQLMHDVIGTSKIKEKIKVSLDGVTISYQNGCHILRPSNVLQFDNPEEPTKLEELVSLTGAKVVRPIGTELCCGSFLLSHDTDVAYSLAIQSIERKGNVDAIAVGCPFCFRQLDMGQIIARRKFGKSFEIPIIFYAQLLGLALGFDAKDLGLDQIHKISTASFLQKVRGSNG
ncbi:MAG: CoB--CoM heterodisulfide reductase iron-sulfur subunit B family protein [Candidatus Bathyarchaeia archaeon]